MKQILFPFLLTGAVLVLTVAAHDLYLKLDNFFVAVNQKISVKVLNGSFMESEGAAAFTRMQANK